MKFAGNPHRARRGRQHGFTCRQCVLIELRDAEDSNRTPSRFLLKPNCRRDRIWKAIQPTNPQDLHERTSSRTTTSSASAWTIIDAEGIQATYTDSAVIEHNEVSGSRYSGISVGLGWADVTNAATNNLVRYDRVHDVLQLMADGGGIYTLSHRPAPWSRRITSTTSLAAPGKAPISWPPFYLDQGSDLMTVQDNVGQHRRHLLDPEPHRSRQHHLEQRRLLGDDHRQFRD